MFFEILLVIFLGILAGIITGLVPGIHVNLVATLAFSFSPYLLNYFDPIGIGSFIIALSVTHSFLDTIPSIYLGAPESENALAVFPGQKMLLAGYGYQAVKISIMGTYSGMILAFFLIPFFMFTASYVITYIKSYLPHIVIIIITFMIVKEKKWIWAILLFLLSGVLGMIVFSFQTLNEPLFPLLSGLFGVSGLFLSYMENTHIPKQYTETNISISFKELTKALFGSSIAVLIIQFIPGFGPTQGAVISSQLVRDVKDKTYLALVGAMGTMSVVFSLVTYYVLGKAKDGSIVMLTKIVDITKEHFILLLVVMLIVGSLSLILTLFFSKWFATLLSRVNYKLMLTIVIVFIVFMSIILDGYVGFLILITSTTIGLIAPLKGIARSHAMGCLIVPVLFYLIL